MNLADITPMILAYNERENLGRCLEQLRWAREVLVVDSFSTDETGEIAASFPNVRVVQRAFDTLARQANFGLSQIRTPWVLSLDADYGVPPAVVEEFARLAETPGRAYAARFTYQVFGKTLRGTLYPPRTVLYPRAGARYLEDGHAHRVQVAGETILLQARLVHDDRKPLARWFASQAAYAALEAEKLRQLPAADLRLTDRIRRWRLLAPWANLAFTLFGRGAIWDGRAGWYYAFQRCAAEIMISLSLLDRDLRHHRSK